MVIVAPDMLMSTVEVGATFVILSLPNIAAAIWVLVTLKTFRLFVGEPVRVTVLPETETVPVAGCMARNWDCAISDVLAAAKSMGVEFAKRLPVTATPVRLTALSL
jgi:hypothetical protein